MYLLLVAALLQNLLGVIEAAELPEFELRDLRGNVHRLSDYRGRWVVVNYWATWCPPCLEEMPELDYFHATFQDSGAMVLGLNLEEIDVSQLRGFVDNILVDYPILMAGGTPPEGMPPIRGLPTTHIVSPSGEIVVTRLGPVTSAVLEALIAEHGGDLQERQNIPVTPRMTISLRSDGTGSCQALPQV